MKNKVSNKRYMFQKLLSVSLRDQKNHRIVKKVQCGILEDGLRPSKSLDLIPLDYYFEVRIEATARLKTAI